MSDITEEQAKRLMDAAISAAANAHAPYSNYKVGAALLLSNGADMVTGCNVENCAYPNTCCAEKTAVCSAVASGRSSFLAIAVSTPCDDRADDYPRMCGSCRQLMCEFCPEEFPIYLVRQSDGRFEKRLLGDYMPGAFRPECLLNSARK